MLKITVRQDEKILFFCDWVDGFDYPFGAFSNEEGVSTCLLRFDNIEVKNFGKIKKNSLLGINYFCNGVVVGDYEVQPVRPFEVMAGCRSLCSSFLVYQELDFFCLSVLKAWEDGFSDFKWYDFESNAKKSSWLNACSLGENSPLFNDNLNAEREILLDLSLLGSQEDFFCALGEATLGPRGYVGKDLDGFYECLGLLNQRRFDGLIFKFHGKFLSNFHDEDFFKKLKNIIEDHGCKILISS